MRRADRVGAGNAMRAVALHVFACMVRVLMHVCTCVFICAGAAQRHTGLQGREKCHAEINSVKHAAVLLCTLNYAVNRSQIQSFSKI